MPKTKMPKEEKSSFSHFFREDAKLVLDVFKDEKESQERLDPFAADKLTSFLNLKQRTALAEEALKDHWRQLRSFFRNGNNSVRTGRKDLHQQY